MKLLLKNGFTVTDKIEKRNIVIDGGRIAGFTGDIPADAEVIDCSGKYIVPGLIDMHVHLREPGQEYKEDLASGSAAAVAGGVTTMCSMANTSPVIDNSTLVSWIVKRSNEIGLCDIIPYACVTRGMAGEELTDMGDILSAGACGFSDDGKPVMNSEVMRRALEYAKSFGAFISVHEEDTALFNKGSINEGRISAITGLRPAPAEAESVMVARDIELARLTGSRVHICHVSSRHSVEFIRRGKERGVRVTAEVTPNHLSLTDEICQTYDTATKVNPPLRTDEDREALLDALKAGVIDCVASDHAPHHMDDKRVEYDIAAFGMLGLQLIVPAMVSFIHDGRLTWTDFVRVTSSMPAKIMGLSDRGRLDDGMLADITVIDPNAEYVFDSTVNKSKSVNTPYWGKLLKGQPVLTLKNGKIVYKI